jgi:acetyltransferase-like isoleucine patch superfamily enzyme
VLARHLNYRLRRKNILSSNKVTIYGLENITTSGWLKIGLSNMGFMNRHDRTFLNIKGKLEFKGKFSIAKGCRFDIGENAVATFGVGYVNPNTTFIIVHGITVGNDSVISWGCQFLDDDLHDLQYAGKLQRGDNRIEIGSHVWIGSNVTVLKGAVIPDGCVIAAGSVVCSKFDAKNALIAGNPARVKRENIHWE